MRILREGDLLITINDIFNSTVINDHDKSEVIVDGVIIMEDGKLCQYIKGKYQSINPLYIMDKEIHVGVASVGGCMRPYKDIDEQINHYNAGIVSGPKVKNIILNPFKEEC